MYLVSSDKKAIAVSAGLLIGIGIFILVEYIRNTA
jgi:hypothetical protein